MCDPFFIFFTASNAGNLHNGEKIKRPGNNPVIAFQSSSK
ncbi:hypothetical protein CLV36_108100 [Laceyella sediminis]|uniref:Uncharacterized protein n=1 Tax=Laceyella sediminis TaxID=573074 RepID=A0ABX5ERB8_9BACL|nr:hypothetical protein CLV36_108100 [Laceyella sediminis]